MPHSTPNEPSRIGLALVCLAIVALMIAVNWLPLVVDVRGHPSMN